MFRLLRLLSRDKSLFKGCQRVSDKVEAEIREKAKHQETVVERAWRILSWVDAKTNPRVVAYVFTRDGCYKVSRVKSFKKNISDDIISFYTYFEPIIANKQTFISKVVVMQGKTIVSVRRLEKTIVPGTKLEVSFEDHLR